ncbi:hypothetical protein N7454_003246 [Penicillium verhagenii]|nr:hypothetical protein N7454_003246 [Penicillium verhagenii]
MDFDEYKHILDLPLPTLEAIIEKILRTPLGSHKATHMIQGLEGTEEHCGSLKTELLGLWKIKLDDDACARIIDEQDDSYELLEHKISNCAKCHLFLFDAPKEANMVTFCFALRGVDKKQREHLLFQTTLEKFIPQCTWNTQWFQTCMEDTSYDYWFKGAIAAACTKNNAGSLEFMMQNPHPDIREEDMLKSDLLIKIVETACRLNPHLIISSTIRSHESQIQEIKDNTKESEGVTIRKVRALGDIRINSLVLQDLRLETMKAGLSEVTRVLDSLFEILNGY